MSANAIALRRLFSIVLPQSWPAVITVSLLHFFFTWNETRLASLYLVLLIVALASEYVQTRTMQLAGQRIARELNVESLAANPERSIWRYLPLLPVSALPNDSLTFATYWLFKDQAARTDIRCRRGVRSVRETSRKGSTMSTVITPEPPPYLGLKRIEPSLHRIFLDKAGPDAAEAERVEVARA